MKDQVAMLKERIQAARGEIPADLVLKGGRVVNVFAGTVQERDVAVHSGRVVGLGKAYHGKLEEDVSGKWVVPGLIDGHLHIESSMMLPSRLAQALIPHGTTAIVSDPHEIANVMGVEGIRFLIEESEGIPLDIFFMAPSCVPATHLETSGATVSLSDLETLKRAARILGLAEMMNYPGLLMGDIHVLEKIVLFADKVIDGHGPGLTGPDLQAYVSAGVSSDHETSDSEEAVEKLESGMRVMIREGSGAKNLDALLPLVNQKNARRFCFVSDDLHPRDLLTRGHMDHMIRRAIQKGLDPVTAVQLATLNPAEHFGLKRRGAVGPGYQADLVILGDIETFAVERVFKRGSPVFDHSGLKTFPCHEDRSIPQWPLKVAPVSPGSFRILQEGALARVIQLIPGQILTGMLLEPVASRDGWVSTHTDRDILKLAVVERHQGSGRIGLGLVKGFGLKAGALASSVAHDSHNIIAVGVEDRDLCTAVKEVCRMGGGMAVAGGDQVLARTPLPVAGLMSLETLENLARQLEDLNLGAGSLGCALSDPFMALSFLALPVVPELKLTDRGLVDVRRFKRVPLFTDQGEPLH
ncbi:MAG: adenine deaminase [Deltaproteobacteria bacterium]|jgi:adenine deaminase